MTVTPAMLKAAFEGRSIEDATPAGIRASEKRGQLEFVAGDAMPVEMYPSRAAFEAVGFVFGERDDPKDIFMPAKLPDGWAKRATDRDVWSDLIDERGRKRGGVFYKAAFYDRKADATLNRRFAVQHHYPLDFIDPLEIRVLDGDVVLRSYRLPARPEGGKPNYDFERAIVKQAGEWLNERYPQWKDPTAYWNE